MFNRIDRYILSQVATPFVMTLAVAAMLLLLERMLRLFDIVANEGGPVGVVFRMLGNLIPQYLGMALPTAVLLGILLGFRKLANNAELETLSGSGMSYLRMLKAPLSVSSVLVVFSLVLIGYIQPQSYYTYQHLLFDLSSGAFGASIRPGEYNNLGNGFTLRIGRSHDEGSRLEEIFAQKERSNGHVTTITAREGRFLATSDGSTILLRLTDGVILDTGQGDKTPRTFRFVQHDWQVALPVIEKFRVRGGKERELTLHELWYKAESETAENSLPFRAAFYDRIVRSLAIILLPFLAVGLGVASRRQQQTLGLTVAIVSLLAFHKSIEFGLAAASLGTLSVFNALILPTIIFACLCFYFFYTTAYRVGIDPLSWLERIIQPAKALVQRFSFHRVEIVQRAGDK